MDFCRGFKIILVFLVVVASLGKGPSTPLLVKREVEGSGLSSGICNSVWRNKNQMCLRKKSFLMQITAQKLL